MKTDGHVGDDAPGGRLLDRGEARRGARELDLEVGGERREAERLADHRGGIAVEGGIGLQAQAALAPGMGCEHGRQDRRTPGAHLLDEGPAELDLRRGGQLCRELADAGRPVVALLAHHLAHDDGVGRRPGGAALDGVGELGDRARVVPVVGGRRLHHRGERAVDEGDGHFGTSSAAATGAAGSQFICQAWSGSTVKCQARVGPAITLR